MSRGGGVIRLLDQVGSEVCIKDNIIQPNINVAYDQPHDHISISQGHKDIKYLTQEHKKFNQKQEKDKKARHSLSKPMIYTYFSPFGNKLPKSLKMHSAMRLSRLDLREVV